MNEENIDDNLVFCPYCKEKIKADAVKCKHCGETLKSTYKNLLKRIKGIIFSKSLRLILGQFVVLALIVKYVGIPLWEQYQVRQSAIEQYKEYVLDSESHKAFIHEILTEYPDFDTPISELNKKIQVVKDLISSDDFDNLVQIMKVGGYASKGTQLSMTKGYGTILSEYVTIKNITDIPLIVNVSFDLESTSYTTETHESWFILPYTSSSTSENKYIIQENVEDSIFLYSKDTNNEIVRFNNINYYIGYRVTRQFNDGSYNYDWDTTQNLKAVNLKIKSIEIYK